MNQLPEGSVLVVSPHLDDAALSCASLLARPHPVDVLTVFAGEPRPPRQGPWDYECGFASSAESLPIRRAEAEAAFAGTPHRLAFMDLVDGQYVDWHHSQREAEAIANAIRAWVENNAADRTVALPAGAGRHLGRLHARLARLRRSRPMQERHPDHVFVRDASLRALSELAGVVPILYEELPYALDGGGSREARRSAAAWGWRPVEFVVDIDRAAKAARISAYTTQVPHLTLDGTRLDLAQNLPPMERFWRLVRSRQSV